MNEKIKELMKQANIGTTQYGDKGEFFDEGDITVERFEKFAELIVRECIRAYNDDGYQTEYEQDQKVLKHFGIKKGITDWRNKYGEESIVVDMYRDVSEAIDARVEK
jgi:hypothetical protein